MDELMMIVVI